MHSFSQPRCSRLSSTDSHWHEWAQPARAREVQPHMTHSVQQVLVIRLTGAWWLAPQLQHFTIANFLPSSFSWKKPFLYIYRIFFIKVAYIQTCVPLHTSQQQFQENHVSTSIRSEAEVVTFVQVIFCGDADCCSSQGRTWTILWKIYFLPHTWWGHIPHMRLFSVP